MYPVFYIFALIAEKQSVLMAFRLLFLAKKTTNF